MEMKSIYLITRLNSDDAKLIDNLERLLKYDEIYALQLYDFNGEPSEHISKVKEICAKNNVPLFIGDDWKTALELEFDGVHYEEIPGNILEIKQKNKNLKIGITTGNDMEKIKAAEKIGADYISFCSIFPSKTANSCEFVNLDSVQKSKNHFSGKIFLAGGITPENIHQLSGLPYDGIAVVSGIFSADDPEKSLIQYLEKIKILS